MRVPNDSFISPLAAGMFLRATNRLLGRERWARERLIAFAGGTVELSCAPLPGLAVQILADGTLAQAPADPGASVAVRLTSASLAALAASLGRDNALADAVQISGNEALAGEVRYLLRHLRWDVEEELSRWIGDALAHRVAGAVRSFAGWQRDAARRLVENVAEYAVDEHRILLQRAELQALSAEIESLSAALARLDERMLRLENSNKEAQGPRASPNSD